MAPLGERQGIALADIVRHFQWTRVGIVACADVYCQGLADGLIAQLAKAGIRPHFRLEVPTP
jgi:hypothetical protein